MKWISTLLAFCIMVLSCPIALAMEEMAGDYKISLSLAASPQNAANALLAASMLDNVEVQPGEVFSFNRAVGPRSAKRGFIIGLVSAKDKYLSDYGGGVCMTASVLHQAVKDAKLKVLERHNHVIRSKYLPLGEDAAVSFGVEDFRFKNNTPYPIRIHAGEVDEALSISIWLVKPDAAIQVNGVSAPAKALVEIDNGVVLVPVRAVAESLGAELSWNANLGRAVIVNDKDILELQVNSNRAFRNQQPIVLDAQPSIRNGVLMLPLKVLADNMDFEANWDQTSKIISITYTSGKTAPAGPAESEPALSAVEL